MSLVNGRALKAARVLAGMTQQQLALAAGLHPNAVKYWERSANCIGGHAVSRMVAALEQHGVHVGEEHAAGVTVAVLRGQFPDALNRGAGQSKVLVTSHRVGRDDALSAALRAPL